MLLLNLRFFDGAAAPAPAAGTAPAASAPAQQEGVQAQAPANETAPDERSVAYAKFKNDFKDLYARDFKTQLDARFKNQKAVEGRVKALDPIVQAVASKYGVDPSNPQAIQEALNADNAFFEREAEESGLTVEQFKHMRELETKARMHDEMQQTAQREAATNQMLEQWNQEAEAAKGLYPDFDINAEATNPETGANFLKLLGIGGIGVRQAYELVHPEALENRIANGAALVAKLTQKQTLDNVRANGLRPPENGGGMPGTSKFDVSQITPEQRAEINKRAMRGELIDLKSAPKF